MASLVLTLRETLRYRGAIGQWSWVLHRLTGLGVVLFLFLHVIDTSWAVFDPAGYEHAIATYQSPLFTLGEFGLIFAVVYHALNGLRIVIFDFRPELWKHQGKAAWWVLGASAVILVPVFIAMLMDVWNHYNSSPFILPLSEVLAGQVIFGAYFVGGAILAGAASFIVGMVRGNDEKALKAGVSAGDQIEKFWWSFMRISGVLIVPLVFGHLAMMHLLQGVFDLTAAGASVIGTDAVNASGTATGFVAARWSFLLGGVAIWKVYDGALLILVSMHGFNGLRLVLTDYTMDSPFARRAVTYLTLMAGVALIVVGILALIGTIEAESITMASEALTKLRGGTGH